MKIVWHSRNILVIAALAVMTVTGFALPTLRTFARCDKFPLPCRYDPSKEDPAYYAEDDRVNPDDPVAPMTAYCKGSVGVDVWSIANSQGTFLFTASGAQIGGALALAQQKGQTILINQVGVFQLLANASGQLIIHNPGYEFDFYCGVATSTSDFSGGQNITPRTSHPTPTRVPNKPTPTPTPVPTTYTITNPVGAGVPSGNGFIAFSASVGTSTARGNMVIRPTNSPDGVPLGYVPKGATIRIIGRDVPHNWIKITYGGIEGWVSPSFVGLTLLQIDALPVVG